MAIARDEHFLSLARFIRRGDRAEAETELDLLARDLEDYTCPHSNAIAKGRLLAARDMAEAAEPRRDAA